MIMIYAMEAKQLVFHVQRLRAEPPVHPSNFNVLPAGGRTSHLFPINQFPIQKMSPNRINDQKNRSKS